MVDWKKLGTGLWTRVKSLNSPWFLDDVTEIVTKAGNVYDVIMLPKVEGPWDIHYADQLVAQLEANEGISRPILFHAILETGQGVALVEDICLASPRMQGISLGPADLAANRAMKTTRVGGGHPMYKVIEDPVEGRERIAAQQDPWHYTLGKMVDACVQAGIKPFYGPFGDIADLAACEQQFKNAFLMGCAGAWSLHPGQIDIAKRVFSPEARRSEIRPPHPRSHARRHRRRDARRQDAGRRHLETGQGHRRPREAGRRERPGDGERRTGSRLFPPPNPPQRKWGRWSRSLSRARREGVHRRRKVSSGSSSP